MNARDHDGTPPRPGLSGRHARDRVCCTCGRRPHDRAAVEPSLPPSLAFPELAGMGLARHRPPPRPLARPCGETGSVFDGAPAPAPHRHYRDVPPFRGLSLP